MLGKDAARGAPSKRLRAFEELLVLAVFMNVPRASALYDKGRGPPETGTIAWRSGLPQSRIA
jgi:hypothetical protein